MNEYEPVESTSAGFFMLNHNVLRLVKNVFCKIITDFIEKLSHNDLYKNTSTLDNEWIDCT